MRLGWARQRQLPGVEAEKQLRQGSTQPVQPASLDCAVLLCQLAAMAAPPEQAQQASATLLRRQAPQQEPAPAKRQR